MAKDERDRAGAQGARQGAQQGAQRHAEGQHGDKTHSRTLEELHSGASGAPRGEGEETAAPKAGRHRLYEDREQHDEADKNSDKNRAEVEIERGRHPIDEARLRGPSR